MPRSKRMVGPPKYYNPAEIAGMPQWAGAPLSHSPTPPRQPEVYLTGDHEVPDVGLGTTVVEPPTTAVIPPGVVRTTIAALQAVAAGGSAVAAPTTVVKRNVVSQTDPMEFPFVAYPRGTKWLLK